MGQNVLLFNSPKLFILTQPCITSWLLYQEVQQYFLSRDWAGLKRNPVHKVLDQLQDHHSRVMQNRHTQKPLAIPWKKYTLRVSLILLTVKKIEGDNFHFVFFFTFYSLVHTCTCNSKTVWCIQTTCSPKYCSTTYHRHSFFWFRIAYKLRLVSQASKHTTF